MSDLNDSTINGDGVSLSSNFACFISDGRRYEVVESAHQIERERFPATRDANRWGYLKMGGALLFPSSCGSAGGAVI
jgi:hypothetical protein